jgi:hypothetical protein
LTPPEKTGQKDFEFFLGQGNFLKVVDTLEKFENGILDKSSAKAREFFLFKRQLYAMYEVQNRSVEEHELFSFTVERKNLLWVYNANLNFVENLSKGDATDQLADNSRLGPNQIFARRTMNPRRLKGLGAFASAYGLFSYAPYLAIYMGATAPYLAAAAAGLYGMLSFSESQIVNSITVIKDGSDLHGKLLINVGLSAFSSTDIVVDVKDVQSIVALGNDDLGYEGEDGNVLHIDRYLDKATGKWVNDARALTLPGDSFRDRRFIDWVLADKKDESSLADDFQDLMIRIQNVERSTGKIGGLDLLAARDTVSIITDSDAMIDHQLKNNDPAVDSLLERLKEIYGADHLKSLTDSELYELYKRHSIAK